MASNFTNTFTGKGTGVVLPSGEGVQRAQQNLNDLVTRVEEMKYKTYRENRDQFIKNSNIDPVFVLSDAGRKYITQRIGDFNKRWGKRFQESGGNLSDKDLLDMQTDKNLIIADQQNQKAQMERFIQHRDLVSKNPDKFDDKAFAEATRQYMETGVYDQPLPAWRPIDFGAYARQVAEKKAFIYDEKPVDVGGGMMSQESWNMPQGTEGRFLVGLLGQNPQADVDFFSRWDKADKEYYFKLADANKDNKTSPDEEKNAIALWAKDEFGDVRLSNRSVPKGKPKPVKATGGTSTLSSMTAGMAVPERRYGDVTYTNSYEFEGKTPLRNIPTQGAKVLYEEGNPNPEESDVLLAGNISGRLLLYNPKKDVLVFETVGSSESADTKGSTLVEVPASNLQGVEDLKITINGQETTVGEMRKRKTTSQQTSMPTQTTSITPTGNSLKERMAKLKGQ